MGSLLLLLVLSEGSLAPPGAPERERREEERRGGKGEVEDEGGGGHSHSLPAHIELSVDGGSDHLKDGDEIAAVARELSLWDAL